MHETGDGDGGPVRGCLATSCVVVGDCLTGGGLLRWQVKSGSSMRFLEEAIRVYVM